MLPTHVSDRKFCTLSRPHRVGPPTLRHLNASTTYVQGQPGHINQSNGCIYSSPYRPDPVKARALTRRHLENAIQPWS
jgi:hypothetical protein